MNFEEKLNNICYKLNIAITHEQIDTFRRFYELLLEWNNRFNLTAITEEDDVILKHFIDSISILNYVDIGSSDKIIDVGTGAGFPGLPLKIMLPDLRLTLLDSVNKKLNFVREASEQFGFSDINIVHGRAEDCGQDVKFREKYDFCFSRAVAHLSVLSELCLPFVKKDGSFVSYKGADSEEEINSAKKAIKELGGKIRKVESFSIPETDIKRAFVIIAKEQGTPKRYPRKAGTPAKQPIV